MSEKIKIKQLAKLAGVSVATVSRAVNFPDMLKDNTLKKVRAAIRKYRYIPNIVARDLSRQSVNSIGVVILANGDIFESEYHLKILSGITFAADRRNFSVVINLLHDEPGKVLNAYFSGLVAGLILIAPYPSDPLLSAIHRNKIPAVIISSKYKNLKSVCVEAGQGFETMFKLLKENGYERIALLTGPNKSYDGAKRYELVMKYMKSYGFEIDKDYIIPGDWSFNSGYSACMELLSLKKIPQVIISSNDLMAAGAYKAISEKGLSIPDDIGVVGFDDINIARMLNPQLSTVAQDLRNLGINAVSLLLDENVKEKNIELPSYLVLRDSLKLKK